METMIQYSNRKRLESLEFVKGKIINTIDIHDNIVEIGFEDATILKMHNDYQCCECRYFLTDDDINYYNGAKVINIETRDTVYKDDVPCYEIDCYGLKNGCDHASSNGAEVQFLLITTNLGVITIQAYNKHNGYYAGINLEYEVK